MLVYATVIMIVLLGFCGLAIDSERAELRTVQLQAIADDAAITAATEYQRGNGGWQAAAANEATTAGAQNGLSGLTTTAYPATANGPYAGDYSTIQVTVTQQLSLTLLTLLNHGNSTGLVARAVAMIPPCSYFMNPSGDSIHLASTGFSTFCPVYNNTSITNDYFSSYNAYQVKVAGSSVQSYNTGHSTHPILFNAPSMSDPLAYVTQPVLGACTSFLTLSVLIPTTLNPGTYCGGITAAATTLYLNPGLYVITGGATFTGTTISGTGVTLFFTKGGLFGYGTVVFNGGSVVNLSAPTDSTGSGIQGVVMFADRSWTPGATAFQFNGCTYKGDGILYLVNSYMSDQYCNMSGNNYFGVVTSFMYEYQSNFVPSANYAALAGGTPFHVPVRLVQ